MRHLLIAIGLAGCHDLESPEPRVPDPTPMVAPCAGEHVQVRSAWTIEVLDALPAPAADRVVIRRGPRVEVARITEIAGAPTTSFGVDAPSQVHVDRDGTVYFRGLWDGNGDQINNVGDGIYRLDGSRAKPVVAPTTRLPGSTLHFNSAGGFSVDDGWLALAGGRPNDISGVYLWRDGQVIAIADTTMPIHGTGTPSVHAGQIAFQGEEHGVRGIYLWSETTGARRVLASTGPIFGGVALADHVVYAGGFEPRRIIAWSAGTEWVAARPEWFAGSVGDQPILQPDPAVRGDDLVVQVAQDQRTELWSVAGCTLSRIAGTGDPAGRSTIRWTWDAGEVEALPGGDLAFVAVLADGSTHLARAHRRE